MITITFWKGELFKGEKTRTVYTDKVEINHVEKDIRFRAADHWEWMWYEKINLNHVSNSDWHQIDVLLPNPRPAGSNGCSHDIECER